MARIVHQRTDSDPFFTVNVVDYIATQGATDANSGRERLAAAARQVETGVPENVRQMIEKQIAQLPADERRLLDEASVAAPEFSSETLARALELEGARVEERCHALVRREQFLRPHLLARLAEALSYAGQAEAGLRALDEALALAERSRERDYEAELHRLKGELLLQAAEISVPRMKTARSASGTDSSLPDPDALTGAEACFREAIELARRQQARSWELRAVMSLSGLYEQQGERAQARQMLQAIYGSFTEGFGTAELQQVKNQLEALS